MSKNVKPKIFVVFGCQGSGKSTQVARLAAKNMLTVFEAGKELRDRAQHDPKIHSFTSSGQLVPDEVMLEIVNDFLHDHPSSHGYVFDGYPRNLNQNEGFQSLAELHHWQPIAVHIVISDETAKDRLANRFTIVNGQKVHREDDTPAIVQKRLNVFKDQTLPVIKLFAQNYRLVEVDGEPPVDEVTTHMFDAVDTL